jgi:hypothetical protein
VQTSDGAKKLIRLLNLKLAPIGKSVAKTQRQHKLRGDYELLNIESGEIEYFALSDLEAMARKLGILAEAETDNPIRPLGNNRHGKT